MISLIKLLNYSLLAPLPATLRFLFLPFIIFLDFFFFIVNLVGEVNYELLAHIVHGTSSART